MNRREFLAGSAGVAGWGFLTTGCNSAPPSQSAAPSAQAHVQAKAAGLQVLFHGLNLFALQDPIKKFVDVGFVNTRRNPMLRVNVHVSTLKIDRGQVHPNSTVIPNAVDEGSAYYTLSGPIEVTPRLSADPSTWGAAPAFDLEWNDTDLGDVNPASEPSADSWNNLRWVPRFTDLYANAALPTGWRDGDGVVGWMRLSNGLLEKGFAADNTAKFQYTINGKQRLLKDQVRYLVPAGKGAFTQFKFGTRGSLLVATDGGIDIFHLPTPGMDVGQGPLTDYYALYELLLTADQLKAIGDPTRRVVPSGRTKKFDGSTPLSGGCTSVAVRE